MPSGNRFTIYDALEKAGAFDSNPANTYARDRSTGATLYKGPVEYPKMFYHPQGEQKIIVPGELIATLMGPKLVNEQKELIWEIANDRQEEEKLRADGWHDHPAKAIRARIEAGVADGSLPATTLKSIPAMSSDQRIKDLEAEIARLTSAKKEEAAKQAEDADIMAASAKAAAPAKAIPSGLAAASPAQANN